MAKLGYSVINDVELTRQAFNLGAISVPIGDLPSSQDYEGIELFDYNKTYPSSVLGKPVLDSVYFNEGKEDEYYLTASPIITLSRPKHIVRSRVRRRAGTVKEIISLGDYIGTIQGTLVNNESLDPPYEEMEQLKLLNEKLGNWEVTSDLFGFLDIFEIMIKDIKFPSRPGMGNSQPYIIEFESDEPINLEI